MLDAEKPGEEALGYSRGGLTSKIHVDCDGKGCPLSLVLGKGTRNDSTVTEVAVDAVRVARKGRGRPRKRPKSMNLDKGYSYPRCRKALRKRRISAMIPEREDQIKHRKKKGRQGGRMIFFDAGRYGRRNVVERCIRRLKQWRRVATRYDKRAAAYMSFVTLAAIFIWLRT